MTTAPKLDIPPDADDPQLLALVVNYYHTTLKGSGEAVDYLHHRGITHPAVIDHFRLGFCDRSFGLKLPSRDSKAGWTLRLRLQELGVFRASGHEHFRGSITVPIPAADGSGQITDVYGRKTQGDRLRRGTDLHTYLGEERRGVWNVEAFGPADEIVVTPSVFDALSFWSNGYRNVTCTFSTTDLPPHLIPALTEFGIRRVLATSEPLAEKFLAAGIETFLVRLPPGRDVNSYMRRADDPADTLGDLLRHAEWCGKGAAPPVPILVPAAVPDAEDGGQAELAELLDAEEGMDEDETGVEADERGPAADARPADPPSVPLVEPPVRTASPLPVVPPPDDVTVSEAEVVFTFGSRRYRVRGLEKNPSADQMKVNVLASNGVGMFVDSFDVYAAKPRKAFVEQAAAEMSVEERVTKADVGRILLKLEEIQDAKFEAACPKADNHPDMTPEDRQAALDLLTDPNLLDRIGADFNIIGDRNTLLVAYLGAVSRKLDNPLSILVQSTSAAGKTTLMDAALAMVPPEDVVKFSALTGQALYYLEPDALKHKILSVAEEAGAQRASYAMKLLASEGELRIASTGKSDTGKLVAQEYVVTGPTSIFTSTTSAGVDEELLNRCVILAVDETPEQTRHIHQKQRERRTLDGLKASVAYRTVRHLHHNMQRLLRSVVVVNPWATKLTFPSNQTRTRRDQQKYLTLIDAMTFLHQHQRKKLTAEIGGQAVEYVEVSLEDIALANELAAAVLGRSLDELPPQTRNLLHLAAEFVAAVTEKEKVERQDVRFTRRQLREFCSWGDTQVKVHLRRLVEMELILTHRDRDARRNVYELAYIPAGDGRALPGLLDVDHLRRGEWSDGGSIRAGFSADRAGQNGHRSGSGRGSVGPRSGCGRGAETVAIPCETSSGPPEPASRPESVNAAAS